MDRIEVRFRADIARKLAREKKEVESYCKVRKGALDALFCCYGDIHSSATMGMLTTDVNLQVSDDDGRTRALTDGEATGICEMLCRDGYEASFVQDEQGNSTKVHIDWSEEHSENEV